MVGSNPQVAVISKHSLFFYCISFGAVTPFLVNNLIYKLFTWIIEEGPDSANMIVIGYPVGKYLCCQTNRVPLGGIASPYAKNGFS